MSMKMKENPPERFSKAKKCPNVRKKRINVKVLCVKFLAWERLKV